MTRFPPPPNPSRAMKTERAIQFGDAPAIMVNIEQMKRDTLNANLRPIISALAPQNKAPNNIPTYTAIVRAREYEGLNS